MKKSSKASKPKSLTLTFETAAGNYVEIDAAEYAKQQGFDNVTDFAKAFMKAYQGYATASERAAEHAGFRPGDAAMEGPDQVADIPGHGKVTNDYDTFQFHNIDKIDEVAFKGMSGWDRRKFMLGE